jgi:hypothetical protein
MRQRKMKQRKSRRGRERNVNMIEVRKRER